MSKIYTIAVISFLPAFGIGFAVLMISLLGILLWQMIKVALYNELKQQKKENQAMKRQLRALQEQQTTTSSVSVKSIIIPATPIVASVFPIVTSDAPTAVTMPSAVSAIPLIVEDTISTQDKILFEKLEATILSEKLYLQPDFTRDEVIKRMHIPKNSFARIFKRCTGVGFTKYINTLRLEHAAKMLKQHPNYTVSFIAGECGIPTPQTFYRLFSDKFGVTPAEYRAKTLEGE